MFDVSFTELMIIGVVALVVIGPERLPKVARTVGHLLGRAQRYVNDVKSDIRREIELDELRKFKENMESAATEVRTSLRDTENSLRDAGDSLRTELDATAQEATQAVAAPATPADTLAAAPASVSETAAAPSAADAPAHTAEDASRTIAPPQPAEPAPHSPPTGTPT